MPVSLTGGHGKVGDKRRVGPVKVSWGAPRGACWKSFKGGLEQEGLASLSGAEVHSKSSREDAAELYHADLLQGGRKVRADGARQDVQDSIDKTDLLAASITRRGTELRDVPKGGDDAGVVRDRADGWDEHRFGDLVDP